MGCIHLSNHKLDDLKSITKAMVTLSVDRRDIAKNVFVTRRVASDTLTHLHEHQGEEDQDVTTLLLGFLMNVIELGGDHFKDVIRVITEGEYRLC